jgi:hypothetical protein
MRDEQQNYYRQRADEGDWFLRHGSKPPFVFGVRLKTDLRPPCSLTHTRPNRRSLLTGEVSFNTF